MDDVPDLNSPEKHDDSERLEAPTPLPASLEVWICPTRDFRFQCRVPKTICFSVRSTDDLKQRDIGWTEVPVSEQRGSITAKVYWLNGQPSADAEARWQPMIERKVRDYLQTSAGQSSRVFIKGILEDSVRQGIDARDLIVAHVDLQARLAELKALDYQPMAEKL